MRKTIIVLMLALLMLVPAAMALAGPLSGGSGGSQVQEREDQRTQQIKERIGLIIARFNNNEQRHIAAYNAAKDKVTDMVTTLQAKGYDVSKLASDLQTWNGTIIQAGQDYSSFISLLQGAEQYDPFA